MGLFHSWSSTKLWSFDRSKKVKFVRKNREISVALVARGERGVWSLNMELWLIQWDTLKRNSWVLRNLGYWYKKITIQTYRLSITFYECGFRRYWDVKIHIQRMVQSRSVVHAVWSVQRYNGCLRNLYAFQKSGISMLWREFFKRKIERERQEWSAVVRFVEEIRIPEQIALLGLRLRPRLIIDASIKHIFLYRKIQD